MKFLGSKQDFDFRETPLRRVAADLSSRGLPVQLDIKTLTDAGLTVDTPFTFRAKSVRGDTALKMMLAAHEASYVIQAEVLLITTREKCATP